MANTFTVKGETDIRETLADMLGGHLEMAKQAMNEWRIGPFLKRPVSITAHRAAVDNLPWDNAYDRA